MFHGQIVEVHVSAIIGVWSHPWWVYKQVISTAGLGQVSPLADGGCQQACRRNRTSSCLFCPSCFFQCGAWGLSSSSNVMGRFKWGVRERHRDSAIILNSSCCIFLTWIYPIAFYSHVNFSHPQLHLVRSLAIQLYAVTNCLYLFVLNLSPSSFFG